MAPAATSFVPLQVSMKSAKDHRPAARAEHGTEQSKPSKVEAWVGQTLQQTAQSSPQQQKKAPRKDNQQKKGSKKRLAANFGGNPDN